MINFFAYDIMLDKEMFLKKFPQTQILGKACRKKATLVFRKYANILFYKTNGTSRSQINGCVYSFPDEYVKELDKIMLCPDLRKKRKISVELENKQYIEAFTYILSYEHNDLERYVLPDNDYFNKLSELYSMWGFSQNKLDDCWLHMAELIKHRERNAEKEKRGDEIYAQTWE